MSTINSIRTKRSDLAIGTFAVWAMAVAACTGMSFGENEAGEDTYLEGHSGDGVEEVGEDGETICRILGSIAVDPRTDTAYVLETSYAAQCGASAGAGAPVVKTLLAVDPDTGISRTVMDLSGSSDLRILFPESGILVMAEHGTTDVLTLLDAETYQVLASKDAGARYYGTRLSPSRRYLAVADNNQSPAPIHLIDTRDLRTISIAHEGEWLEAMWLAGSDTLAAAIFTHGWFEEPGAGQTPDVRIALWSVDEESFAAAAAVEAVENDDDPGAGELWAEPRLDVHVPGARMDFFFSFTWIGVDPTGGQLVVPVVFYPEGGGFEGGEHRLLVLDTGSGEVRQVVDAAGPVGFTPDGASIVSYRYVPTGEVDSGGNELRDPALLIVDSESLEEEVLPLPDIEGGPSFFVTHEGNFVVVASNTGRSSLVLFDLDHDSRTRMEGLEVDLWEFVSRTDAAEIWLVDQGLFVLDVVLADWERVDPGFTPNHVNLLPGRDLLVLDDPDAHRLVFFDPESRSLVRAVDLPRTNVPSGGQPTS